MVFVRMSVATGTVLMLLIDLWECSGAAGNTARTAIVTGRLHCPICCRKSRAGHSLHFLGLWHKIFLLEKGTEGGYLRFALKGIKKHQESKVMGKNEVSAQCSHRKNKRAKEAGGSNSAISLT